MIDYEDCYSGTPNVCTPYEFGTFPPKMSSPAMTTGIEEACDLTCFGIEPGNVRALKTVIIIAGIGQILGFSETAMFHCIDMI